MFIVDTNILISELLSKYETDELCRKYRLFYQKIPLLKRAIPDFILNEFELYMVQVVPSRYDEQMVSQEKKEIREITRSYMEKIVEECTLIAPSLTVIKSAFQLYTQFVSTHFISFTDSLLLATARDHSYTLLTKDRRLKMRAKELDIAYFET